MHRACQLINKGIKMKALNLALQIELAGFLASSMAELEYSSLPAAKAGIAAYSELKSCFEEELDELREWGAEELPEGLSHAAIKLGLLSACQLHAAYKMAIAISGPLILNSIEHNSIG